MEKRTLEMKIVKTQRSMEKVRPRNRKCQQGLENKDKRNKID